MENQTAAACACSESAFSSVCCGSALPFLPAAEKDTVNKGPAPTLNALPCVSSVSALPDEI